MGQAKLMSYGSVASRTLKGSGVDSEAAATGTYLFTKNGGDISVRYGAGWLFVWPFDSVGASLRVILTAPDPDLRSIDDDCEKTNMIMSASLAQCVGYHPVDVNMRNAQGLSLRCLPMPDHVSHID